MSALLKIRVLFGTVLVAALTVPVAAQTSTSDTTFLNRNIRQQMFLIGYLQDRAPQGPPVSDAEVDAFIAGAATAWAAEAEGEDPHVARLNPYVARWLVLSAYAKAEAEVPDPTDCRVYSEHVVPAFLADYGRYREVSEAHAPLIFWGHNYVGGPLAFRCDLGRQRWVELEAALLAAPSLYQQYLDVGAIPNDDVESKVQRARRYFVQRAPLYAIRGALYRGDLDGAFADLAAATQEYEAAFLLPLGETLWRAYADSQATNHALATLDLLARTMTAVDLPRDTLLTWYAEADPERGPTRFGLMTGSTLPALILSGERVELSGPYTDLLTGEPVDLGDLTGNLVLLDFWATWCGPCIAEIPDLQALVAEHGDRVTFVSVNADAVTGAEGPDGVRAFMDEHGVDYPVLYDDVDRSLAAQFGVGGYPAKFLIGPDGVLLQHPSSGRRTVSLDEVETYLESLR